MLTQRFCSRYGHAPTCVGMLLLLALSVVAGWPILMGNGLWYLDNPAHLAETLERAQSDWSGWSDLAFCGFPLGQWHSNVAYGVLAAWVRLGLPVRLVYIMALWIAFIFPSVVLFIGSRTRLGVARATFLASILLLQPPALVGIESAWGGMWTFYLAAGLLLWLMQRWSSGRFSLFADAALIGGIGLLHLFVFAALPLLAALQIVFSFRRKTGTGRSMVMVLGACVIGALASAAFWIPNGSAQIGSEWTPQNLSSGRLLWALAVPCDLQVLTSATPIAWKEFGQPGLLPMLALLGFGVAGGFRRARSSESHPGKLGFSFACAVLMVLLLLPLLPSGVSRVWGPVSWRFLYFVRIGLAWSAVGALVPAHCGSMSVKRSGLLRWGAACLLMLALGWWVAAPLRRAVHDPDNRLQREVQALWAAIRETSTPGEAGRIYLQDTYRNPDLPPGLPQHSHILAYTAAATGVRQLGAYYGMAPQATAYWTSGEFGRLLGVSPDDPEAVSTVMERLRHGHCTRLVVVSPVWARLLAGQRDFIPEYRSEWFTLYRIALADNMGVEVLSGEARTTLEQVRPCEIRIAVAAEEEGGAIRLSSAWHPHWTLTAPDQVRAGPDETGLWRIDNLPAGQCAVHLSYRPPQWPLWISWGLWILFALAAGQKVFIARQPTGHV